MSPKTTNLAILFADIVGSTRLYETLGDSSARKMVANCLGIISAVVERYHGTVVKTIGDEVMATFPTAEDAVTAACEMNEELGEDFTAGTGGGRVRLAIRVGLHYGPAILEHGDVFGDAVNIAARMASMAKASQIITTQQTVDLLPPILRASTRFVDRAPVKGKKGTIDIHEVIWQQEDVTRMATGIISVKEPKASLLLHYGDKECRIDEDTTTMILGRSVTCDLTVNEKMASRQHVRLEWRRGKFYLIDQSTNGTYFRDREGNVSFIRREEMSLDRSGEISLGRPFRENPSEVIGLTLEEHTLR